MFFCPVIFLARWVGLAAFVAAALSVPAQQTIQFTRPVDPDLSSKANAFLPPANARRNSAGAFNAPSPLFGSSDPAASFEVLPGSPNLNAAAAASAAQWQKFLEGKKKWTLMTPEEILGVPTPETIMGLADPNVDPKLSLEERFLQRPDALASPGATNGYHRPDAAYWRENSTTDPLHRRDDNDRLGQNLERGNPGAARNSYPPNPNLNLNPLLEAKQRLDSAWANPFGLPEPLPRQTPEQLAGMERFRALMEPSVPEKTPEPSRFSSPPAVAPDPNMQIEPVFNPNGRSFTPLASGIARPTGLTPLPGVTGPHLAPAKKTAVLVQLPPWLSDTPELFTPPQRKF